MKNIVTLLVLLYAPMLLLSQNYASNVAKKGDGYYTDKDGVKHEGKLKLTRTTVASFYKFKPAELSIKRADGSKDEFTLENVKKIVIEEDTFEIITDYVLRFTDLGKETKIVIPFDVMKYIRKGEINVYEYRYFFAASSFQVPEVWYQKGNEPPITYSSGDPDAAEKIFNMAKDKPAVYKKWKFGNKKELRKLQKANPYQFIDDYNGAS